MGPRPKIIHCSHDPLANGAWQEGEGNQFRALLVTAKFTSLWEPLFLGLLKRAEVTR